MILYKFNLFIDSLICLNKLADCHITSQRSISLWNLKSEMTYLNTQLKNVFLHGKGAHMSRDHVHIEITRSSRTWKTIWPLFRPTLFSLLLQCLKTHFRALWLFMKMQNAIINICALLLLCSTKRFGGLRLLVNIKCKLQWDKDLFLQ